MSLGDRLLPRALLASVALALVAGTSLVAQTNTAVTGLNTRAVGGISIDPAGMATTATMEDFGQLRKARLDLLDRVPEGLDSATKMRKVSLRRLDEAIAESARARKPLPIEIECLGGLQQIRYVLVDTEQHDVVLVGPADAWEVDRQGAIVGQNNGRPTLLLDDLVVALRAAAAPVRSVISCSIDPTPEGLQRVNAFAKRLPRNGNRQAIARAMEQQLGPQAVSVTGVPATSHYARVMVAADYQMKRIGMGTRPAPVRGLPPFTKMGAGSANALPRWWLAPDYDPLLRDADGLAWELRGASVKAMAEEDFFSAAGVRRESRRAGAGAQRWADALTERYDELALAEPVFGQLQGCMDLAIVAALVVGENLAEKAQVRLPMLMGSEGLACAELPAPKQVESKATLVAGRRWKVVCGGVQINAWEMVAGAETSDTLADLRKEATLRSDRWWD